MITVTLFEGDQVIRKGQRDAYRKLKEREERRANAPTFTFTNMEQIAKVTKEIDPTQLGYLLFLQTFIDYDTNTLVQGRNKRPMTRQDMMAAMKVTKDTFRAFYGVMERYSIIMEVDGRFVINDAYHFRGSASGRCVVKIYNIRTRKLYQSIRSVRKVKQLGYLYRLLPYIHMRDNIICSNPYEKRPENIQAMNKGDISKALGIDVTTTTRLIRSLTIDDMHVMAEVIRGRERLYMVNPLICSRGDYPKTLDAIFLCKSGK
jgi:hypothetical protein